MNSFKLGKLSILLLSIVLSGCSGLSLKLATPFKTLSNNPQQELYLVVVTRADYKSDKLSTDKFNELTEAVLDNIASAKGLYGYSVRKDFLGNTSWTYTIWENSKAMNNFKVSEHHIKAMQSAGDVLQQASFARTFIGPEELNYSWDKALALLELDGRSYAFSSNGASETYPHLSTK